MIDGIDCADLKKKKGSEDCVTRNEVKEIKGSGSSHLLLTVRVPFPSVVVFAPPGYEATVSPRGGHAQWDDRRDLSSLRIARCAATQKYSPSAGVSLRAARSIQILLLAASRA